MNLLYSFVQQSVSGLLSTSIGSTEGDIAKFRPFNKAMCIASSVTLTAVMFVTSFQSS
jgi:hypothetical protein